MWPKDKYAFGLAVIFLLLGLERLSALGDPTKWWLAQALGPMWLAAAASWLYRAYRTPKADL